MIKQKISNIVVNNDIFKALQKDKGQPKMEMK